MALKHTVCVSNQVSLQVQFLSLKLFFIRLKNKLVPQKEYFKIDSIKLMLQLFEL